LATAWELVKELYGWRRFNNCRDLAGLLGPTQTPYASSDGSASKASLKRASVVGGS
jgi:transposase